jgi:hypothetical protein
MAFLIDIVSVVVFFWCWCAGAYNCFMTFRSRDEVAWRPYRRRFLLYWAVGVATAMAMWALGYPLSLSHNGDAPTSYIQR